MYLPKTNQEMSVAANIFIDKAKNTTKESGFKFWLEFLHCG
jgi:hypothetical protein